MNVTEKVATLEALLQRVQRNAAARPPRAPAGPTAGVAAVAAAAAARAQVQPPPARAPEPSWDDVIHALEAEGAPKLTALAAPLHTGAAAKQAAAAAKAPDKPAAAAKAPDKPAAAAKAPAAAAKAPAARPAEPVKPAASPPAARPAEPKPAAALPRPQPAAAKAPVPAEKRPAEPKPAAAAKAADFFPAAAKAPAASDESELSFAGLLPDEPGLAKPPTPKPAETTPSPKVARENQPRFPSLGTTPRPAEAEKPAVVTTPVIAIEPPRAAAPAAARRVTEEPTVERDVKDMLVDDEPTVVRGAMVEDEPTVIRTRPEGLVEDDETVVRSARSEAVDVARTLTIEDEATRTATPDQATLAAAAEKTEPERISIPKVITTEPMPKEAAPPAAAAAEPRVEEKTPEPKPTARIPAVPSAGLPVPEPEPRPKGRSSLWLGIAAMLLVGGAVFAALEFGWFGPTPSPLPPTATPETPPPPKATEPAEAPTGPAGALSPTGAPSGEPTAAAEASAAPTASAAPSAAATPAADDAKDLAPNKGYLLVNSPETASVYVNGQLAGKTNERLTVLCGTRNVRLGKLTDDARAVPQWSSGGQASVIACKSTTTLSLTPSPQPPPTPSPPRTGAAPTPPTPPPQPPPGDTPYP